MLEKYLIIVGMKILILAALEKEISVLNKMINAKAKGDYCFAKMMNYEIYTAITGVGILNSLSQTCSLLENIDPDMVINIGTAGGHTLEVDDGDVVICDEAIYHGGYIMTNSPTSTWETIEDTDLIIKGDEKLSNLLEKINIDVPIHHGKTLSGDFFTRDLETIKSLNNKYHHLCEDMETIAIYRACQKKKIPVIAYRIISNSELKGTFYHDKIYEVNEKLQTIIVQLLNYLDSH